MIREHERVEVTLEHGYVRCSLGSQTMYQGSIAGIGIENVLNSLREVLRSALEGKDAR